MDERFFYSGGIHMPLEKRYISSEVEPALQKRWEQLKLFKFSPNHQGQVYAIDTPPATVSGNLHLGHVFSYSHPDFIARFYRMNGYNVFYPMGFDDNGLPTERLVEKRYGIHPSKVGREEFIQKCIQVSREAEEEYKDLWQRLGLSIDWDHSYRTIDENARRISQLSFIDLFRKDLVYRREAPSLWCPECHTAIAQAEVDDIERQSEMVTIPFILEDGTHLPIATTRPELLAACVAVFVHPDDPRFANRIGALVRVPIYGQTVSIIADTNADPKKGTGIVMCCTFGDQTDVAWWFAHKLPYIEVIDRDGRMTSTAGPLAGLPINEARTKIKIILQDDGLILARQNLTQTVRVHERCDTPIETIVTLQWFVRVLENRELLLEAGENINWHPEHMRARYSHWVKNLNWDWCISRQRAYGVTIPVWYCKNCNEIILGVEEDLPVDPLIQLPSQPCPVCGSKAFIPESDVMDTWATSSLSPLIVTQWLNDPTLHKKLFPLTLRPQGHEIIRTWAFYSILKSLYHFNKLPWSDVLISGWGIAGEGMGKISKSKGGGPIGPQEMIERYSADALRYWAASTSPGKDAVISEEKIQAGARLVTKLWNVARFAEPFIVHPSSSSVDARLTPADSWIRARTAQVIEAASHAMIDYDYASAKNEIESFFWHDLADNYLEMVKQRLYAMNSLSHTAARHTLSQVLCAVLKLMAPFLPHVTEAIFLSMFADDEKRPSIHTSTWPRAQDFSPLERRSGDAAIGETLVAIAVAVRRYKSEHNLSLASELDRLQLSPESRHIELIRAAEADLLSITRARKIELVADFPPTAVVSQIDSVGRYAIFPVD
jgi:valyl-tRNA synthetase